MEIQHRLCHFHRLRYFLIDGFLLLLAGLVSTKIPALSSSSSVNGHSRELAPVNHKNNQKNTTSHSSLTYSNFVFFFFKFLDENSHFEIVILEAFDFLAKTEHAITLFAGSSFDALVT